MSFINKILNGKYFVKKSLEWESNMRFNDYSSKFYNIRTGKYSEKKSFQWESNMRFNDYSSKLYNIRLENIPKKHLLNENQTWDWMIIVVNYIMFSI